MSIIATDALSGSRHITISTVQIGPRHGPHLSIGRRITDQSVGSFCATAHYLRLAWQAPRAPAEQRVGWGTGGTGGVEPITSGSWTGSSDQGPDETFTICFNVSEDGTEVVTGGLGCMGIHSRWTSTRTAVPAWSRTSRFPSSTGPSTTSSQVAEPRVAPSTAKPRRAKPWWEIVRPRGRRRPVPERTRRLSVRPMRFDEPLPSADFHESIGGFRSRGNMTYTERWSASSTKSTAASMFPSIERVRMPSRASVSSYVPASNWKMPRPHHASSAPYGSPR